jgi:hypothetical protein
MPHIIGEADSENSEDALESLDWPQDWEHQISSTEVVPAFIP